MIRHKCETSGWGSNHRGGETVRQTDSLGRDTPARDMNQIKTRTSHELDLKETTNMLNKQSTLFTVR